MLSQQAHPSRNFRSLCVHPLQRFSRGLLGRVDDIAFFTANRTTAFTAVSVCLLVLRKRDPARPRVFRTPLAWLVGPIAIVGCLYLFWSLPRSTQFWFLVWNAIGVVAYLAYGRHSSLLAKGRDA